MEKSYIKLLDGNKAWANQMKADNPSFFTDMADGQSPDYLWIGCSDSRVPAEEITGTNPGEIFVHRNIANMVINTDLNLLSVLSYAVEYLKVKHIIVCGHYGCGGVLAAMSNKQFGIIDNWLRDIKDVYRMHAEELDAISSEKDRADRLVELNVMEQVHDLCKTYIVQNAWQREQPLHIHGWVYNMKNGLIKDLDVTFRSSKDLHHAVYQVENI